MVFRQWAHLSHAFLGTRWYSSPRVNIKIYAPFPRVQASTTVHLSRGCLYESLCEKKSESVCLDYSEKILLLIIIWYRIYEYIIRSDTFSMT